MTEEKYKKECMKANRWLVFIFFGLPLILILLLSLGSCVETQNNFTKDWAEFKEIEGLECLLYKKHMNYGTAISCNWEKYNKENNND